jgi:hypothetical protein
MVSRGKLSAAIQAQVRQRAQHLCEFCHASEQWQYVKFTVDHTIPRSLGGRDELENLALACFHCNRRKTNRVTAVDPQSGTAVSLFNPRQEHWQEHFMWSKDGRFILGITATGRATVTALALNRERVIAIRAADREMGRHPPAADPIQP